MAAISTDRQFAQGLINQYYDCSIHRLIKSMAKDVVIRLTKEQAEALLILAGEGILTDVGQVRGSLKGSTVAAENTLNKLREAVHGEG
ncbi:MAG: hypothetical protein Q6L68_07045 [Thermostichus sp. DG02_5_bins_236]